MTRSSVPDNWWPHWLRDLETENSLGADQVVVAEIEATANEQRRYSHLFTALVPTEHLAAVLEHPGCVGHDVSSTGPHPEELHGEWDYSPRFWVDATDSLPEGLEPLIVSWKAGSDTVVLPDQGFLMTYGLAPRLVTTDDTPDMRWDDLSRPLADVVIARTLSKYRFPTFSGASVKVRSDYLQDYATIRNRALVQVYYVQRMGPLTDDIRSALGTERHMEFDLKGRLLDLRLEPGDAASPVLAQVWGVRLLLVPGPAPISGERWDYGELGWPGIQQPVTRESARSISLLDVVYVRDSVLGLYEGKDEFDIHPESGAVSYGNRWSVSFTRRIGRDLIALELKKLYEGTRPEMVRDWHSHAVPPPANLTAISKERNVGMRARRIVYGLADLGEALARLGQQVLGQSVSAKDFAGLDRANLDYYGWWRTADVEPISRHIPLDLREDEFLIRCSYLHKLVVEGLGEATLRRSLDLLGVPRDDSKDWRSLNLLRCLLRLAELSNRSGLSLLDAASVLVARLASDQVPSQIPVLFALNDLRQLAGHRARENRERRLHDALRQFQLDPREFRAGWGMALDVIYDGVGDEVEDASSILHRAIGAQ